MGRVKGQGGGVAAGEVDSRGRELGMRERGKRGGGCSRDKRGRKSDVRLILMAIRVHGARFLSCPYVYILILICVIT